MRQVLKPVVKPVKPPKPRLGEKQLWDSLSLGTYVKKKHGELK